MELNILVFPCGSEIALELHRSLQFSRHIKLYGANSIDDHGKFVYEDYIDNLPFYDDVDFVDALNAIIAEKKIDAIYPAMDAVMSKLTEHQSEINCKIIGSSNTTNQVCLSKKLTYQALENTVNCPVCYDYSDLSHVSFPLFMKPDVGYGSRGAKVVNSILEVSNQLENYPNSLIMEYLPGIELTVDCFTDRYGKLRFYGPRQRKRVSNGISVNTQIYAKDQEQIKNIVESINEKISFRGAWFVQLKYNSFGQLTLLEVAARFGGSSSLYRNLGVNFGLLSIFDAFDFDIDIFTNNFNIVLDRALDNKYKVDIEYDIVYCDFDDCLVIDQKVNTKLLSFLYQCVNDNKKIVLITKHERDIHNTLLYFRLNGIFDEIVHLTKEDQKYKHISTVKSIFIDDSHVERKEVFKQLNIPVFAPDGVESLIK